MTEGFDFVDEGRTFCCSVEQPCSTRRDAWWWFRVSSEDHQRFAPFRADADDTPESVRPRIVAFYAHLLEAGATPYTRHWPRGRGEESTAPASAASASPTA